MPPLPLLAVPLALCLGEVRGTYETQARAEVRARSVLQGDVAQGSATSDVELVPAARVGLESGELGASLWYSPRIVVREPQEEGRPQYLHRARLLAERGAGRRFHTWVAQYVGYGTTDLSLLTGTGAGTGAGADAGPAPGAGPGEPPGTPGPTPGGPGGGAGGGGGPTGPDVPSPTAPTLRAVRYLESDTSVGLEARLDPRLSLSAALSYVVTGGANDEARVSLPLQKGPAARSALEYRATRRDTLRALATAQYAWFSSGQRITLTTLRGEATRQLGRHTQATAGAGAGASFFRADGLPSAQRLYPLAATGITHEVPLRAHRLAGALGAAVAPTVDPFTGTVLQRFEGSAALGFTAGGAWAVGARATYAQSLPPDGALPDRATVAEVTAGYPLSPRWTVDAGWRRVWQRAGIPGVPTDRTWLGFAAVTFTEAGAL